MGAADPAPGDGGAVICCSRPGRRIRCRRGHAAALAPVFDDPDAWFAGGAAELLKHDRTTSVVRVTLSGVSFHLKRYNTKGAWHALRRAFRRSRAMNCWTMAQRFLAAGIPTAPPAAMIQETFGPFRLRSYFITESVAGARLADALRADPGAAPALARGLAAIFRRLAAQRLSHGDFKASNILVAADGALCLLDLDAARRHRVAAIHRRAWLGDRARLLRNFAAEPALQELFANALPPALWSEPEN